MRRETVELLRMMADELKSNLALFSLDLRNTIRVMRGKPRLCWVCQEREERESTSLCEGCRAAGARPRRD